MFVKGSFKFENNIPPTINNNNEIRGAAFVCRLQLLPSVCCCSAVTELHSEAIIHVITTLLLWQPVFHVRQWLSILS